MARWNSNPSSPETEANPSPGSWHTFGNVLDKFSNYADMFFFLNCNDKAFWIHYCSYSLLWLTGVVLAVVVVCHAKMRDKSWFLRNWNWYNTDGMPVRWQHRGMRNGGPNNRAVKRRCRVLQCDYIVCSMDSAQLLWCTSVTLDLMSMQKTLWNPNWAASVQTKAHL